MQTLSRLNRCHPGKETTYVLDFVNDSQDVLEAFKTYFATATLEDATDPNIVLNLRTKLDGYGFYDEPEIERVVAVELDPNAKQRQLESAIAPVADRLLKQFTAAKVAFNGAEAKKDEDAAKAAKDKMNALLLFRVDMATYQRVYTFLSQIFDYGNTDFEKRSIFFKYLLRLLEFGREREGVDLSQVVFTHHSLRNKGKQNMKLTDDSYPELSPLSEAGSDWGPPPGRCPGLRRPYRIRQEVPGRTGAVSGSVCHAAHHRHDARLHRIGQVWPAFDDGLQIGVNEGVFCTNCCA